MDIDVLRYETTSRSLREHLQPFREWFETVRTLESRCQLEIQYPRNERFYKSWVVPYPYKVPMYIEILHAKYPNSQVFYEGDVLGLTDDEVRRWSSGIIIGRVQSFLTEAFDDETIAEIDSNWDYGVVIHSTTGAIRPFDYSLTKGIHLCSYSNVAEGVLFWRVRNKLRSTDPTKVHIVDDRIRELRNEKDRFTLYLSFDYEKGTDGDGFNEYDNYSLIGRGATYTAPLISEFKTYLESMFQSHAKVIVVP